MPVKWSKSPFSSFPLWTSGIDSKYSGGKEDDNKKYLAEGITIVRNLFAPDSKAKIDSQMINWLEEAKAFHKYQEIRQRELGEDMAVETLSYGQKLMRVQTIVCGSLFLVERYDLLCALTHDDVDIRNCFQFLNEANRQHHS
jgi:hypothetical protein